MSELLTAGDRIYIRDLALRCIIGVNDDERSEKQDVVINIIMVMDGTRAGVTDDIHDAVNYKPIKKRVIETVESSEFQLIERLAEEIASVCLSHPRVRQVQVTVDKPMALRFTRSVAVEIVRGKDHA